jgi:hypothetical protein
VRGSAEVQAMCCTLKCTWCTYWATACLDFCCRVYVQDMPVVCLVAAGCHAAYRFCLSSALLSSVPPLLGLQVHGVMSSSG